MTCDSATESCSLSNRFADLGLLGVGNLDVFDVPALQNRKIETETSTKTNNEAEKSQMSNAGLSILNALPLKPAFCVVQFLEDADCDNLLNAYWKNSTEQPKWTQQAFLLQIILFHIFYLPFNHQKNIHLGFLFALLKSDIYYAY